MEEFARNNQPEQVANYETNLMAAMGKCDQARCSLHEFVWQAIDGINNDTYDQRLDFEPTVMASQLATKDFYQQIIEADDISDHEKLEIITTDMAYDLYEFNYKTSEVFGDGREQFVKDYADIRQVVDEQLRQSLPAGEVWQQLDTNHRHILANQAISQIVEGYSQQYLQTLNQVAEYMIDEHLEQL